MAVGFLAPTHVPIRVHLSDYRASLARACMVHGVRPPFSTYTDRVNTEGSVRRGTRASPL
jgi:hypothetical protein